MNSGNMQLAARTFAPALLFACATAHAAILTPPPLAFSCHTSQLGIRVPCISAFSAESQGREASHGGLALRPAAKGQAAGELEVAGSFLHPEGLPPGASVRLLPWRRLARLPETPRPELQPLTGPVGPDGSFRVVAPEAGMWQLLAEAPGMLPLSLPLLPLTEPMDLPAAVWPRETRCSVQVRDPAARPLAGAVVLAAPNEATRRPVEPEPQWETAPARGETDAKGEFLFPCRNGERLRLEVSARGFAPYREEIRAGGSVKVALSAGRPFQLQIRDTGEPAVGTRGWLDGHDLPIAVAGEGGAFSGHAPRGRSVRLRLLSADGRAEGEVLLPAATEPAAAKISLRAVPILTGRVNALADGRPIAGALVWSGRRATVWVVADHNGRYALPAPLERPLNVRAQATGTFGELFDLVVFPPGNSPVGPTIPLRAATSLTGWVKDRERNPLATVELRARPEAQEMRSLPLALRHTASRTHSNSKGFFRLGKVVPGAAYEIRLAKAGLAPEVVTAIAPVEGERAPPLELTMSAGFMARGQVLDPEQRPFVGARVTLVPSASPALADRVQQLRDPDPAQSLAATSGADGRFELRNGRAGRYDLEVHAARYVTFRKAGLRFEAATEAVDLGVLILTPEALVEGWVTDRDGQAIAGAEIRVLAADEVRAAVEDAPGTAAPPNAVTGSDGRFRLGGQSNGDRLKLRASAAGFVPSERWGVEVPTEQPVPFRLERLCGVLGRVSDDRGQAIAGAQITAVQWRAQVVAGVGVSMPKAEDTTSAEDGTFRLAQLAPGAAEIEARFPGLRTATRKLEIGCSADPGAMELVLEQGTTLSGSVLSAQGEAVIGAEIGLYEPPQPGVYSYSAPLTRSDGDGRYRLDGLTPGPIALAARHAAFGEVVVSLELSAGEWTQDFQFEHGAVLRGQVIDEFGEPVALARVRLRAAGRALGIAEPLSDAAGRFEFSGLAPGSYSASAVARDGARTASPVEVILRDADPDPILLKVLAGGTAVGRLLGLSATDLAKAEVLSADDLFVRGEVAADGGYRMTRLGPGRKTLVARVAGTGRHADGVVEVLPGDEAVLDLDFGRGVALSGSVRLNGAPLRRGAVAVALGDGFGARGDTDEDGRFQLEGLTPGSWLVEISSVEGEVLWRQVVDLTEDRVLHVHEVVGEIRGIVRDVVSGEPVAGAMVQLMWGSGAWAGQSLRITTTDGSGTFAFPRVPQGAWVTTALAPGYRMASGIATFGSRNELLLPRAE